MGGFHQLSPSLSRARIAASSLHTGHRSYKSGMYQYPWKACSVWSVLYCCTEHRAAKPCKTHGSVLSPQNQNKKKDRKKYITFQCACGFVAASQWIWGRFVRLWAEVYDQQFSANLRGKKDRQAQPEKSTTRYTWPNDRESVRLPWVRQRAKAKEYTFFRPGGRWSCLAHGRGGLVRVK